MSYSKEDFSNPSRFLTTIWKSQYGPAFDPKIVEQFWERDQEIVEQHYPAMFNLDRTNALDACVAVTGLIGELSFDKGWIQRAWWPVFHAAFHLGMITEFTWGRAARVMYQFHGLGPKDDGSHLDAILPGLREADPWGMMNADERETWLAIPPNLTLCRGGCANTERELAQGISWTNSEFIAREFANRRVAQREEFGMEYRPARVVHAIVPRTAIFAVLNWGGQNEYMVDYEKLGRAQIGAAAVAAEQLRRVQASLGGMPLGLF